jgi:N6-L-threonylcarbamoyladenine synthase
VEPGPILGIESSCDETATAVLGKDGEVLSNCVFSQVEAHAPYGGVVPEIASREHLARIAPLVEEALRQAQVSPDALSGIAATRGPGLIGALLVGLQFGKGMAFALGKPFVGVHHIEGHLMASSVDPRAPKPPFIGLVVSGGHTALYLYKGLGDVELIGETRDDAAGEAFDKTAKLLGLGYPGGAIIDKIAESGDPSRYKLPISLRSRQHDDFSFSGLKTAVRLLIEKERSADQSLRDKDLHDICASLRFAIVEALVMKAIRVCRKKQVLTLVLGGGVAANSLLRTEVVRRANQNGITAYIPPRHLCTDNAVMIAAAGRAHLRAGRRDSLDIAAKPSLPLSG